MACLIAFNDDHLEVTVTWKNSPERYGALSIGLHWLMAAIMVAVYACINLHEVYGRTPADSVAEVHEVIGTLGYFLIGLHAAAALFHHYFIKDNTLVRMLPRRDR